MASYPSYDNNWWITGMTTARYASLISETGEPLNNWAVQGYQPPGSTFKLVTATAALNTGLITPQSIIDDTGSYPLPGGKPLVDADNGALGPINVVTALTRSSDVFFYTLGGRFWGARATYGLTPIQNEAHLYGLGVPSRIDLPAGEVQNGWVDSLQTRKLLHAQAPKVYAAASVVPRRQRRDGLRPGRDRRHARPARDGVRDVRQRRHPLRGRARRRRRLSFGPRRPALRPRALDHVTMSAVTRQTILAGLEGAVQNPLGTAYADFVGFNFAKWNIPARQGRRPSP